MPSSKMFISSCPLIMHAKMLSQNNDYHDFLAKKTHFEWIPDALTLCRGELWWSENDLPAVVEHCTHLLEYGVLQVIVSVCFQAAPRTAQLVVVQLIQQHQLSS
ncbi:hypothetical protein WR25_15417 [Diploscapter pachys]|uniref:Uncharacterized protein n=1 Tax=Diploscapter pachys TaxID=2018661 RepID=A0A2A2LN53_9BILA|nr:hypothetical protein WR25_15417 [Diploscapter pachys]